jgi:ubiquinone/menaquinone biosynthesis C-methylase UbiE
MFRAGKRRRSFGSRLKSAVSALVGAHDVYGLEWTDPEVNPPLRYIRDHFVKPYVTADTTVLEVGPGGGRWTRYMLTAKRIYAVDFHQELLDELKSNFGAPNITYIKNNGDDFPGVPDGSIDFLFSFGTFVHLDVEIIGRYLLNMRRVLKPRASVLLHYSDKTKPLAQSNSGFSVNDPDTMRALVSSHGYAIYEEDTKTLWHSSIIRFGVSPESPQRD